MRTIKLILTTIVTLTSLNAFAIPITATTGSDFTVDYDAIGGSPVVSIDGLSAQVRYYDFNFAYDAIGDVTTVGFDFDVYNNSSLPILTSRISTIGFNTTPNVVLGSSSVSGIFNTVNDGNVPNQGVVELCFTGVNCAGGGRGGVGIGDTLSGLASLSFLGEWDSFDFDNFTVRYQSVSCTDAFVNSGGICPGSASGSYTTKVPEPGVVGLLAMGLIGIAVARRKLTI